MQIEYSKIKIFILPIMAYSEEIYTSYLNHLGAYFVLKIVPKIGFLKIEYFVGRYFHYWAARFYTPEKGSGSFL